MDNKKNDYINGFEAIRDYTYEISGLEPDCESRPHYDWNSITPLFQKHKLFFPFAQDYVPPFHNHDAFFSLYRAKREKIEKRHLVLVDQAYETIKLMIQNNLHPVVMKGPILSYLIYGDFCARQYSDLDIILLESEMVKADSILREEKFNEIYTDLVSKEQVCLQYPLLRSRWHHEFYPYKKNNPDGSFSSVEIAKQLHFSIPADQMEEFFAHTIIICDKGYTFPSFDLEHVFVCMVENTFSNAEEFELPGCVSGGIKLRDLIELYLFIVKYGKKMDYPYLRSIISCHRLDVALLYVLSTLWYLYDGRATILQAFGSRVGIDKFDAERSDVWNELLGGEAILFKKTLSNHRCTVPSSTILPLGIMSWSFDVPCDKGIIVKIEIRYLGNKLLLAFQVNQEQYSRITFFLYRDDILCQNEITIQAGTSATVIVKNKVLTDNDEFTSSLKQIGDCFLSNENCGAEIQLDREVLNWSDDPIRSFGVGFLLEEHIFGSVYQRAFNVGIPPHQYLLLSPDSAD